MLIVIAQFSSARCNECTILRTDKVNRSGHRYEYHCVRQPFYTKRLSRIIPSAAAGNRVLTPGGGISISDVFIVGLPILLLASSQTASASRVDSSFSREGNAPFPVLRARPISSSLAQSSSLVASLLPRKDRSCILTTFLLSLFPIKAGKTPGRSGIAAAFLGKERIPPTFLRLYTYSRTRYILFPRRICDRPYKRMWACRGTRTKGE